MAMEISENNLNNDLVAALLDRVMIPYSINEDGRFSIVDQFEIYAVVKEDHIILYDIYSFKDSTDQSTRMKVANDINDNLRLVRAAATDAGTVVLDYEVIVIGGISPQAVITSIRKFQTLVSSALGRYAREYLK